MQRLSKLSAIFSYSLYGKGRRYNGGAFMNAVLLRKLLPHAKMHVYIAPGVTDEVKELLPQFSNVVVHPEPPSKGTSGMLWRLKPAYTQEADVVVILDIDAWICQWRLDRMEDWLESGKDFHILRPFNRAMGGGLWAVRNNAVCGMKQPPYDIHTEFGHDESFLRDHIYPTAKDNACVHVQGYFKWNKDSPHTFPEWNNELNTQHVSVWTTERYERVLKQVREEYLLRPGNKKKRIGVEDVDGIMSFSLYGKGARYNAGMLRTILAFPDMYPGWRMIIYVAPGVREDIKEILPRFKFVEVREAPPSKESSGMFWRFQPIIRKEAEVVLVRDADSILSQYHKDMVEEWLNSPYDLHSVRISGPRPMPGCFIDVKPACLGEIEEPDYTIPRAWGADEVWIDKHIYQDNWYKCMTHTARNAPEVKAGYKVPLTDNKLYMKPHTTHCTEADYSIYMHEALSYLRREEEKDNAGDQR